jgi:putative hydrolase of the HAD superfamily
VKVISFDADGTLIDLNFVNTFWDVEVPKLYAEKFGLNFEKAFNIVRQSYDELGDEDLRWYQPEYWFERFKLDESPDKVINRIKNKVKIFPDALETIDCLHKKHDLIVVSNAPREFLDLGIREIKHYFSKVYSCTSDFGMVRKRPDVYHRICEDLSINPGQMVHVGDHYKFDYEVPQSIGIKAYFLDRINGSNGGLKDLRELLQKLEF